MSGNPDKASIWGDADVFVATDLEALLPATVLDPFPASYELVGLLDGEAGIEESRSRDSTDYFAWGGLLIRTARRKFVLTRKFIALEENAVTMGLVWPGSGPDERSIPNPNARFKFGFETIDGATVKRAITRRYAEVEEVGTIKQSESELTKLEITIKIYPDADGVLFDTQGDGEVLTVESLAILPATDTIAIAEFSKLTATATYSDASTLDVTALCTWSSDTPADAVVDRGYVEGISDGAAVVTGTYNGISSTAAITVTV